MGVFGLTTYYAEKRTVVSDKFDLVEEASKRGGIEILVDYSGFVVEVFSKSFLDPPGDNVSSRLYICHAEYDNFRVFVSNIITKLRKCNIELVFFTDGAFGSDKANFARKFETRKERHQSGIDTVTHIQDCCRGHEASDGAILVPPLASYQIWYVIREFCCKVVHTPGEADVAIAKYLVANEKAFAVLGNDSDFCVMKGCRFIPDDWFDLKHELDSVGDLQHLEVRLITPEKVVAALKLQSHEELVELAILKGCDFTKPYIHKYLQAELRRLHMEELAQWFIENIRPVGCLEAFEPLQSHLESNQELKEAITFSRDFYNLVLNDEKPFSGLGQYLDTAVRNSKLPGEVLAWYNGICWNNLLIEDLSLGKPAISPALQDLRKVMYAIVKERGDVEVTEYGRTSTKSFHEAKVAKADFKIWPLADEIENLSHNARLRLFDVIASHLEKQVRSKITEEQLKKRKYVHPFFKTFGTKQAFLYYIINYLLTLSEHKENSLNISTEEFLVVTAMAFRSETQMPIRHENVKPSIRCFTIASWFQETFRHFVYLARILLIDDEFPEPQSVFIGRHFVACFMEVENAVKQGSRLPDFSDDIMQHHHYIVQNNLLLGKKRMKYFIDVNHTSVGSPTPVPAAPSSTAGSTRSTNATYGEFSVVADDEDSCCIPQGLQDRMMDEPDVDSKASAYEEELDAPATVDGVLPILAYKDRILEHIKNHRITCIQGETGCGKSTKVPQFILDDYERNPRSYSGRAHIVVTQPRRIAAKSLAERVAAEAKTVVGKKVGYKIGQDYCADKNTQLLFVTTGYFLQFFVHNPMYFKNFSHVILDEIHERDMDSDLVSLIVKLLAQDNTDTKIIIMSATLQGDMFLRYFASNVELQAMSRRTLYVGAKRFPVEEIYLEDLNCHFGDVLDKSHKVQILEGIRCFNMKKLSVYVDQKQENESATRICLLIEELQKDGVLQNSQLTNKPSPQWSPLSRRELCAGVVRSCAAPGEAILVFLPGENTIDNLFEALIPFEERRGPGWKCLIRLFVLHSKIPFQEQMDVFSIPPAGRAHVILATNIAESSLTVPNVRVVIDYGQKKQLAYDTKRRVNVLRLNWCSKASLDQRKGRTGRIFEGKCIRLFTKRFHTKLSDFDMPQIQVSPLDKLVLRVKHLGQKIAPHCKPSELLSQAIEPPRVENIQEAVQTLADVGAIEYADETAAVTLLGSTAMLLPSDLRLCRLVLYGVHFACPCDAIVMAAALQSKDPFSMPTKKILKDDAKFVRSLSQSTTKRAHFDHDQYSEPIMLRNVVMAWLEYAHRALRNTKTRGERKSIKMPPSVMDVRKQFCQTNALHLSRFLSLEGMVVDIAGAVVKMLDKDSPTRSQVKTLLTAFPTHRRGTTAEEPQRAYGLTGDEASTLFVHDTMMLNFVLAAAFSPAILQGVTLKEGLQQTGNALKKSNTLVKDMQESAMDPKGTICVPNVPDTLHCDTTHLSDVLKRIARSAKLQMVSNERLFLEYKRQVIGRPKNRVINDIPLDAHALYQFGEGREVFPVQLPRASNSTVDEDGKARVQLRKPTQPYLINWSLMSIGGAALRSSKKVCKPRFEWKNPIAFACETEGIDHYAVGCKFTSSSTCSGWIDGVSVLPSDCDNLISLLLILAFQPKHFEAKFKISSKEKRILSVELFGHECKFSAKHPLTTELLCVLNELREAVSNVFGKHASSATRVIPECNLTPWVDRLIREAKVPGGGSSKSKTKQTEAKHRQQNGVKPVECNNRFTALLSNGETSDAAEDEKSKKDVVFTISAFEPDQEESGVFEENRAQFVLLKPYNEIVLQDRFIASQVNHPCKEHQDHGINTMIESLPANDSSDDEAIPVLRLLHLWLEDELGEELLKRSPESVSLETLVNSPKVHAFVEECEQESGRMFIWKDFFDNMSAQFHCIANDSGSYEIGLTPAGKKKFSQRQKQLLDRKGKQQQQQPQSRSFDTVDQARDTQASAASKPLHFATENVPPFARSGPTTSQVPSWEVEKSSPSVGSSSVRPKLIKQARKTSNRIPYLTVSTEVLSTKDTCRRRHRRENFNTKRTASSNAIATFNNCIGEELTYLLSVFLLRESNIPMQVKMASKDKVKCLLKQTNNHIRKKKGDLPDVLVHFLKKRKETFELTKNENPKRSWWLSHVCLRSTLVAGALSGGSVSNFTEAGTVLNETQNGPRCAEINESMETDFASRAQPEPVETVQTEQSDAHISLQSTRGSYCQASAVNHFDENGLFSHSETQRSLVSQSSIKEADNRNEGHLCSAIVTETVLQQASTDYVTLLTCEEINAVSHERSCIQVDTMQATEREPCRILALHKTATVECLDHESDQHSYLDCSHDLKHCQDGAPSEDTCRDLSVIKEELCSFLIKRLQETNNTPILVSNTTGDQELVPFMRELEGSLYTSFTWIAFLREREDIFETRLAQTPIFQFRLTPEKVGKLWYRLKEPLVQGELGNKCAEEIPETSPACQLEIPVRTKTAPQISVKELEEQLAKSVTFLLQRKQGRELFCKVAVDPEIRTITENVKTITGLRFKWLPFLRRFSTQITATKIGIGHWLSLPVKVEQPHTRPVSYGNPACQPLTMATTGNRLPSNTQCGTTTGAQLSSASDEPNEAEEALEDFPLQSCQGISGDSHLSIEVSEASVNATGATLDDLSYLERQSGFESMSDPIEAVDQLKVCDASLNDTVGNNSPSDTQSGFTSESESASDSTGPAGKEAYMQNETGGNTNLSAFPCISETGSVQHLENTLEEVLCKCFQTSAEYHLLACVGNNPQECRPPFNWKSFLSKHSDCFATSGFDGTGKSCVRFTPSSVSQYLENPCAHSGSKDIDIDGPGGHLFAPRKGVGESQQQPLETLTENISTPSCNKEVKSLSVTKTGVQVGTLLYSAAPPLDEATPANSFVDWTEGQTCKDDLVDSNKCQAADPSTDTCEQCAMNKQRLCNILVTRLLETNNKPILVSNAAKDQELVPIIRQLRKSPSTYFRWITFLTERDEIFEIRLPQTPSFQFLLKAEKMEMQCTCVVKETMEMPCDSHAANKVPPETVERRLSVIGKTEEPHEDCQLQSCPASSSDLSVMVSQSSVIATGATTGNHSCPDGQPGSHSRAESTAKQGGPCDGEDYMEHGQGTIPPISDIGMMDQLENTLNRLVCEYVGVSAENQLLARVGAHPPIQAVVKELRQRQNPPFKWKTFLLKHSDCFEISEFGTTGVQHVRLRQFKEQLPSSHDIRGHDNLVAESVITETDLHGMGMHESPASAAASVTQQQSSTITPMCVDNGKVAFLAWEEIETSPVRQACLQVDTDPATEEESGSSLALHEPTTLQSSDGSTSDQAYVDDSVDVNISQASTTAEVTGGDGPVTKQEICSRLVKRLRQSNNMPILVSDAASDKELVPLIQQLRSSSSASFRWITFLRERADIFEIRHAQTASFQFLLADKFDRIKVSSQLSLVQGEDLSKCAAVVNGTPGHLSESQLVERIPAEAEESQTASETSIEELEEQIAESICLILRRKESPELLRTLVVVPEIRKNTDEAEGITGVRFEWMPFLNRFSAQITTTSANEAEDYWLSLTGKTEEAHDDCPFQPCQGSSGDSHLSIKVSEASVIVMGATLDDLSCLDKSGSTAGVQSMPDPIEAADLLKVCDASLSGTVGTNSLSDIQSGSTSESESTSYCTGPTDNEAYMENETGGNQNLSSSFPCFLELDTVQHLENTLEEVLCKCFQTSAEYHLLACVGINPQECRPPFNWKSFLSKHSDCFEMSGFDGTGKRCVRFAQLKDSWKAPPHSSGSQYLENLCAHSESNDIDIDGLGRHLFVPRYAASEPQQLLSEILTENISTPSCKKEMKSLSVTQTGAQVGTLIYSAAPPLDEATPANSFVDWTEGQTCKDDLVDSNKCQVADPSKDTCERCTMIKQRLCNILVTRLLETNNKPILVSNAAKDQEIVPIIRQLRNSPSTYFRWITFLTERDEIFEIRLPQTPSFQFLLKAEKMEMQCTCVVKETMEMPFDSHAANMVPPETVERRLSVLGKKEEPHEDCQLQSCPASSSDLSVMVSQSSVIATGATAGNHSCPDGQPGSHSIAESTSNQSGPFDGEDYMEHEQGTNGAVSSCLPPIPDVGMMDQLENTLKRLVCEYVGVSAENKLLARVGAHPPIQAVVKELRQRQNPPFKWKTFLSKNSDCFDISEFGTTGMQHVRLRQFKEPLASSHDIRSHDNLVAESVIMETDLHGMGMHESPASAAASVTQQQSSTITPMCVDNSEVAFLASEEIETSPVRQACLQVDTDPATEEESGSSLALHEPTTLQSSDGSTSDQAYVDDSVDVKISQASTTAEVTGGDGPVMKQEICSRLVERLRQSNNMPILVSDAASDKELVPLIQQLRSSSSASFRWITFLRERAEIFEIRHAQTASFQFLLADKFDRIKVSSQLPLVQGEDLSKYAAVVSETPGHLSESQLVERIPAEAEESQTASETSIEELEEQIAESICLILRRKESPELLRTLVVVSEIRKNTDEAEGITGGRFEWMPFLKRFSAQITTTSANEAEDYWLSLTGKTEEADDDCSLQPCQGSSGDSHLSIEVSEASVIVMGATLDELSCLDKSGSTAGVQSMPDPIEAADLLKVCDASLSGTVGTNSLSDIQSGSTSESESTSYCTGPTDNEAYMENETGGNQNLSSSFPCFLELDTVQHLENTLEEVLCKCFQTSAEYHLLACVGINPQECRPPFNWKSFLSKHSDCFEMSGFDGTGKRCVRFAQLKDSWNAPPPSSGSQYLENLCAHSESNDIDIDGLGRHLFVPRYAASEPQQLLSETPTENISTPSCNNEMKSLSGTQTGVQVGTLLYSAAPPLDEATPANSFVDWTEGQTCKDDLVDSNKCQVADPSKDTCERCSMIKQRLCNILVTRLLETNNKPILVSNAAKDQEIVPIIRQLRNSPSTYFRWITFLTERDEIFEIRLPQTPSFQFLLKAEKMEMQCTCVVKETMEMSFDSHAANMVPPETVGHWLSVLGKKEEPHEDCQLQSCAASSSDLSVMVSQSSVIATGATAGNHSCPDGQPGSHSIAESTSNQSGPFDGEDYMEHEQGTNGAVSSCLPPIPDVGMMDQLENTLKRLVCEYVGVSAENQLLARVGAHPPIQAVVKELRQRQNPPFKWKTFLLKHSDCFDISEFGTTGVQHVRLRQFKEQLASPPDIRSRDNLVAESVIMETDLHGMGMHESPASAAASVTQQQSSTITPMCVDNSEVAFLALEEIETSPVRQACLQVDTDPATEEESGSSMALHEPTTLQSSDGSTSDQAYVDDSVDVKIIQASTTAKVTGGDGPVMKQEICSRLVKRLRQSNNMPILVSDAASDKELVPLIQQLRSSSSASFRWITFLRERAEIFEIRHAQTASFQFLLADKFDRIKVSSQLPLVQGEDLSKYAAVVNETPGHLSESQLVERIPAEAEESQTASETSIKELEEQIAESMCFILRRKKSPELLCTLVAVPEIRKNADEAEGITGAKFEWMPFLNRFSAQITTTSADGAEDYWISPTGKTEEAHGDCPFQPYQGSSGDSHLSVEVPKATVTATGAILDDLSCLEKSGSTAGDESMSGPIEAVDLLKVSDASLSDTVVNNPLSDAQAGSTSEGQSASDCTGHTDKEANIETETCVNEPLTSSPCLSETGLVRHLENMLKEVLCKYLQASAKYQLLACVGSDPHVKAVVKQLRHVQHPPFNWKSFLSKHSDCFEMSGFDGSGQRCVSWKASPPLSGSQSLCNILVTRLLETNNKPILVSKAANDQELMPIIQQLRKSPSTSFRWITFLTKRDEIFQIRLPKTPNFQFLLRPEYEAERRS